MKETRMKKKILLDVHKENGTNNLLLDSQDVFNFIGETTNKEMQLFHYLDKWCEWLNYNCLLSRMHRNGFDFEQAIIPRKNGSRHLIYDGAKMKGE